ncbi:MAG: GerMN domain-containing protein [Candidatus Methylomirabilales bacterium]
MALLIGSLGVTAGILWDLWPLLGAASVLRARGPIARTVAHEPPGQRRLRLILPDAEGGAARERDVDIPRRPLLRAEVQAALAALQREAALPAGLEVRHAFLDAFGILYVDFGPGFAAWLAAAPAEAARGLRAALATLAASFEGVARVQFLAEGHEVRAAAAGLDLQRPLLPAPDAGDAEGPPTAEAGPGPAPR